MSERRLILLEGKYYPGGIVSPVGCSKPLKHETTFEATIMEADIEVNQMGLNEFCWDSCSVREDCPGYQYFSGGEKK